MTTPYWGQLPGPKTSRRNSGDYAGAAAGASNATDRRQSLDEAAASQAQQPSRSNRVSLQTTKSDAPTESTQSPFVSPTASSFAGQELAPRPPSLPYGANQYPPELLENRRRRRSRNQEQDLEYAAEPPPAAPEVPKLPPSSYKHPFGNGGLPYTHPRSGAGGPPRPSKLMDGPEEYYKSATPDRKDGEEQLPVLDRNRNTLDGKPRRNGSGVVPARNPAVTEVMNGGGHHQRRASSDSARHQKRGSLEPDRRKFADDRSPLQRLELTLDSITKEEKRARIEAAERAARERSEAAGHVLQKSPPTQQQAQPQATQQPQQQVRFRERRASVSQDAAPIRQGQYAPDQTGAGPLSQNPPEETRRHASVGRKVPLAQVPSGAPVVVAPAQTQAPVIAAPRPKVVSQTQASGIPQRNLSFRERAAKSDMKMPNGFEPDTPPQASPPSGASSTGSFSLTRTGSNKLRKNPPAKKSPPQQKKPTDESPPGDTWVTNLKELDMDEQYPMVERYPTVPTNGAAAKPAGGAAPPKPRGASVRVQVPGEAPELARPNASRQVSGGGVRDALGVQHEFDGPSQPPVIRPPVRTASQRKADQILGRLPSQNNKMPPNIGAQRNPPTQATKLPISAAAAAAAAGTAGALTAAASRRPPVGKAEAHEEDEGEDDYDDEDDEGDEHDDHGKPSLRVFQPTQYLDEWKKATVGTLSGSLLDLSDEDPIPSTKKDQTWWETPPSQRRGSMSARPQKAEAFDGEYDDTHAPTRFKPPLYLKCGPLLRFCGIRHDRVPSRSARNGVVNEKEIWRGSVMIVTTDDDSSYEIAPTLRLFVQPVELLPPPPAVIDGEESLAPEHVDPIAGHPKLGRKGETLYVRPVDHLPEGKDLSTDETDEGLFEKAKSPPDVPLENGLTDPPGSFTARRKRIGIDGEKVSKYKDIRGFRLHSERGYTFWRFNIEVELKETQQRIAYRINRGPSTGFWVPAKGQAMNIMFYSCNGFSLSVVPDQLNGPDPMWRDVLNTHQSQPFHVMIGGGDQIYNDACMRRTKIFKNWLDSKNPLYKQNAPFTAAMQDELETFFLHNYCTWFSHGLFGMANAQIPMVNMYDDHDIIDGFGSYPDGYMNSPVFSGLGNVAFKYYMLFQHQSVPEETEATEPSWTLGLHPGPYIHEVSRSLFMHLGSHMALLAVDARTERTREEIIREDTWKKIMDRCYAEIVKGRTQHLLVLLGVPIAYPSLTSRFMGPVKALGKTGIFGHMLNRFDGGIEVLDDLDDHWTAKTHKHERSIVVEDLQDLAADKSVRITILSGDVHLAAVGQFYSNPKLGIAKHKDFRYIPNVISSAIVNTPPSDLMADVLNKRNKVHHFDHETDEDMIPLFTHDVDGKPRNNKRLLPHRNWCAIREYVPGDTPPPTPPPDLSAYDVTPMATPPGTASGGFGGGPGGFLRRLSQSRKTRGPTFRGPDGVLDKPKPRSQSVSRPPLSGGGGLFRSFSRRRGASMSASENQVGQLQQQQQPKQPGFLTRALSGSGGGRGLGGIFRRSSSAKKKDDGGINGQWGPDSEEEEEVGGADWYGSSQEYATPPTSSGRQYRAQAQAQSGGSGRLGLRGGGGDSPHGSYDEFEQGDERAFTVRQPSVRRGNETAAAAVAARNKPLPQTPQAQGPPSALVMSGAAGGHHSDHDVGQDNFHPKPFHRTPTGLSAKQRKNAKDYAVDLEGGLEICLNVEVSPKDPAGITVPYRLLVPRLFYEYEGEEPEPEPEPEHPPRGQGAQEVGNEGDDDDEYDDDDQEGDEQGYYGQEQEKPVSAVRRFFSLRGKSNA